jgi:hypothetical protein
MECPQCGGREFNEDVDPNGREIIICNDCNYKDDFTGFCTDLIMIAPELFKATKKLIHIVNQSAVLYYQYRAEINKIENLINI